MTPVTLPTNQAELLAVRLMTGLIALAAIVEGVLAVDALNNNTNTLSSTEIVVGGFLGLGIPIIGGIVAIRGTLRRLRFANGATALAHVAVALSWVIFFHPEGQVFDASIVWILASGPSIAAAMMAWGLRWAWLVFFLTSVVVPVAHYLQVGSSQHSSAAIDGLTSLTFSLAFLGVIIALLTAARTLDARTQEARLNVEIVAAQHASARSQQETNDFIHDDILSTLMFASGNNPAVRAAVAIQATKALKAIDDLSWQTDSPWAVIPVTEFLSEITQTCRAADPHITVTGEGNLGASLPQPVAETMLAALTQAAANSVSHASTANSTAAIVRDVTVHALSDVVTITISDDGAGFEPTRVSADRLGIRRSIVGRMAALDGGSAQVTSRPGEGTTVVLKWNEPTLQAAAAADRDTPRFNFDFRRSITWAIASVFLACTALICAVRVAASPNPLPSVIAWICLAACVGVLGSSSSRVATASRTSVIILVTMIAASLQFFEAPSAEPPRVTSWYLTSIAAILLVLVFQHHARLAWFGMLGMVAIVVTSALLHDALNPDHLAVLIRPLLILSFGTIFLIPLNIFHGRIQRLRVAEELRIAEEVFDQTARAHRHHSALQLKFDAGSLLDTLSLGLELTGSQVAQCVALEGTLRDQSRGHRLTQPQLVDAARLARMRGVDVVLLDDAQHSPLRPEDVASVNSWMAEQLTNVPVGRFTGRILPRGREDIATIVVNASDEETSLSFP